jgi:hypothetical protein
VEGKTMCNILELGGLSSILGGGTEMHFDPKNGGSTYLSETSATLLTSTQLRYPREKSNSNEEI